MYQQLIGYLKHVKNYHYVSCVEIWFFFSGGNQSIKHSRVYNKSWCAVLP